MNMSVCTSWGLSQATQTAEGTGIQGSLEVLLSTVQCVGYLLQPLGERFSGGSPEVSNLL